MSYTLSDAEVKEIIDTTVTPLTAFITVANQMVADHCSSLEDANQKEIARWLAAHFTAMRERQLESQKIGEGEDQYEGKFDLGLNFTQYGQTAMQLDSTGALARWNKQLISGKKAASINWLGYDDYDTTP